MAAPLDALTANVLLSFTWDAAKNKVGIAYQPTRNNTPINKNIAFTLGTGANQANQVYSSLLSIAASSSTTLDLDSLTNVLDQASADFAKVKVVIIRLLSAADDSVNGTAASSITVGNAAANAFTSQSGSGFLGGATHTFDIPNGGFMAFGVGNASGVAVDATHDSLKILNNDSSLAAKVEVTLIGTE